jgi:peptide/nickel transport system substrate-binding protein
MAHVSLAPSWFDPAETQGIYPSSWCSTRCTDAMVKPMRGQGGGTVPAVRGRLPLDGLTHDFVIRKGKSFTTASR